MTKNKDAIDRVFDIERKQVTFAYIKGVGRFCQCGCDKKVFGRKDKLFFNKKHATKFYMHTNRKPDIGGIRAWVGIKDKTLHLFVHKGLKKEIKIKREWSELWDFLDLMERFRFGEPDTILIK